MTTNAIETTGPLTHDELVVVSDILGRMQTAAENGNTNLMKIAAGFALNPEFATALKKIDDAKIATRPSQAAAERNPRGTGKPKLWISTAQTPYGNEYGLVAVLAERREEAIAKARARLESALAGENYVPRRRYGQALLDNLESMSDAGDVVVNWEPAETKRR